MGAAIPLFFIMRIAASREAFLNVSDSRFLAAVASSFASCACCCALVALFVISCNSAKVDSFSSVKAWILPKSVAVFKVACCCAASVFL